MVRETSPETRGSTVDRLVEVGERLFAQHGLDGVSLRQIAAESGTSNNSAVRYHFGSKEALVTAIIEYRLPDIIQRRELLAARSDPDDLRSVLEAHLLPTMDMAESADNHYLIFIEQLQRYGRSTNHPFLRCLGTVAQLASEVSSEQPETCCRTCLMHFGRRGSEPLQTCACTPRPTVSGRFTSVRHGAAMRCTSTTSSTDWWAI